METPFTAVRVDKTTHQVINAIAEAEDRTQGAIVRRALMAYLEHAEPEIRHLAAAVVVGPEFPRFARKNGNGQQQQAVRR